MAINHSKTVFTGKIIRLDLENVTLPNGDVCDMEITYHPGGAVVAAINDNNEICILKQYRHAVRKWLWELPAGKNEPETSELDTAKRELEEEAGVQADEWQSLGVMYPSPGVFTEVIHLFLATKIRPAQQQLEHGEVIEIHWVKLSDAVKKVLSGEINDAKSCLAIIRAADRSGLLASITS